MVSSKGRVSFLSKSIGGCTLYDMSCFCIFSNVTLILLLVNFICFGFRALNCHACFSFNALLHRPLCFTEHFPIGR